MPATSAALIAMTPTTPPTAGPRSRARRGRPAAVCASRSSSSISAALVGVGAVSDRSRGASPGGSMVMDGPVDGVAGSGSTSHSVHWATRCSWTLLLLDGDLRGAGESPQLVVRRPEHRVGVTRGGPDLREGGEGRVEVGRDRRRVSERGHPADGLAGVLADEVRRRAAELATPIVAAVLAVSTRCAPEVRISTGVPAASKTRELAIAPTSQPMLAAAAAAVRTPSSKTCRGWRPASHPRARSSASTGSIRAAMLGRMAGSAEL